MIAILDITCSNPTKVFWNSKRGKIKWLHKGGCSWNQFDPTIFSSKSSTGICRFEMLRQFWWSVVLRSFRSGPRMISRRYFSQQDFFWLMSEVQTLDGGPGLSGSHPFWHMFKKYLGAEASENHQLVLVNCGMIMTRLDENQDQRFTDQNQPILRSINFIRRSNRLSHRLVPRTLIRSIYRNVIWFGRFGYINGLRRWWFDCG